MDILIQETHIVTEALIGMKLKEYKLSRTEERHPYLNICREIEYHTDIFTTSYDIASLMVEEYDMNQLFIEYVYVLGFDCSNRLLGIVELGHQTDTQTTTPIRELFISLLLMGANNFILVHNHPNNSLEPSIEDMNLTNKILLSANLLDIMFRDAIIVCDEDFTSLKAQGIF